MTSQPDEPTAAETPPSGDAPSASAPKPSLRARAEGLVTRTQQARQAIGTRTSELETRHASVRVALAAYRRDRRQAGGLLAGGLAFRLFLWLLPTALTLASVVEIVSTTSGTSPATLAEDAGLGRALAAAVAQGAQASEHGAWWLLVLGVVLMLWAATGMVKALRILAAVTWQITPGKLRHAPRWAAGFSAVTFATMLIPFLLGPLFAGGLVSDLIASLITIAVYAAAGLWAMYRLPRPEGTGWIDLLPGAVLMAVGVEILRFVTAVYLAPRLGRTEDLYGALGLAAVFLTWLYLAGRILVAGFALNAERWRSSHGTDVDTKTDGASPSVTP